MPREWLKLLLRACRDEYGCRRAVWERQGHFCDFVGCEIDKDYFEAAQKRFKQQTSQMDILQQLEVTQDRHVYQSEMVLT